ncbi:hypothetical protein [Lebetimonas sp. JS032]|uniref:hypothetical protein n=1 Tax=Lebetimonas sp. JS032 TaxID=990070 RepID=UPI0004B9D49E|nr:hypothetical protein [Lebetimonas sp. JS032]
MLPTPSELRAEEFELLNKHISDRYCLTPTLPKVKTKIAKLRLTIRFAIFISLSII